MNTLIKNKILKQHLSAEKRNNIQLKFKIYNLQYNLQLKFKI